MDVRNLTVTIVVFMLLVVSFSNVFVAAQVEYENQVTTNVTIPFSGVFSADASVVNISYEITGVPGATGTVTAVVYNGNPYPTGTIPDGISLTHFVAITFDMNANEFTQAKITISYADADVENLGLPYAVFKYYPSTNSYGSLSSIVDTTAKTITVTLNSVNDPVFAIGGVSTAPGEFTVLDWGMLAGAIFAIALLVVFLVNFMRKSGDSKSSFKF